MLDKSNFKSDIDKRKLYTSYLKIWSKYNSSLLVIEDQLHKIKSEAKRRKLRTLKVVLSQKKQDEYFDFAKLIEYDISGL